VCFGVFCVKKDIHSLNNWDEKMALKFDLKKRLLMLLGGEAQLDCCSFHRFTLNYSFMYFKKL